MFAPYQDPDPAFALFSNSPLQEAQMDNDDPSLRPSTLLKGSVYRSGNGGSDSIWSKIGSGIGKVVGGVAHFVEDALPYVAQAASAYANASLAASAANTKSTVGNWSDLALSRRNSGLSNRRSQLQSQPVTIRTTSSTIAQNALNRIPNYRSTPNVSMSQMAATSRRVLNDIANTQGLPSYEEFHQQNGMVYRHQPDHGNLGVQRYQAQIQSQSNGFLPNDVGPIQGAQMPRRYYQSDFIQQRSGDISSSVVMSKPVALPKAEYQGRTEGKVNLWQKLQQGQVLSDAEMKQLFHSLDLQQAQSKTALEKINAALSWLHAEDQLARNMVLNAARDTNGNLHIHGTSVHFKDALAFAKQDIQHFQRTDQHLPPQQDWKSQLATKNKKDTWVDLVRDWFFETGPQSRVYDATHPITQALMRDEGVQQARKKWIQAGKPSNPPPYPYSFSVGEYARELLELDGTGSTLGSYIVRIQRLPHNMLKFTVDNTIGWESGTRLPFAPYDTPSIEDVLTGKSKSSVYPSRNPKMKFPRNYLPKSIMSDKNRPEPGPGGNMRQKYVWYEKAP